MNVSTEAIIISTMKFGDTSKIISAFTKEYGKLSFIAKGAFSPKSKFISTTDTLNYVNMFFNYKSSKDLLILTNSETVKNYKLLKSNLEKLALSMLICESIDQTQVRGAENEKLFHFTVKCFELLNEIDFNSVLALPVFEIFHAENNGYQVSFEPLDFELNQADNEYVFVSLVNTYSAKNKELLRGNYVRLSYQSYKLLHTIKNNFSLEELNNISFDLKEICYFFECYFTYHIGKKFTYNSLYLLA